MENNRIFTIGHSTHPIDEFIRMLQAYQIALLVDVRTIPGSRRNPQFNREELEYALQSHGIDYLHLKELGGLRHPARASTNTAWKNSSFRGYADYMQTGEFLAGVQRLVELARSRQTAIMCAEAVPWRCHRSLIADALLVRGLEVIDILGEESSKPHDLTPWARVDGLAITYPGSGQADDA
jgi:uncharacterized protein (DUF488 family)